jgi:hypothetical protein
MKSIFRKKAFWIISFLFILLIFILTFRPIVNPKMDQCSKYSGILLKARSDTVNKDIFFRLDNTEKRFYINRGLENGLTDSTMDTLIGKEIVVFAVNHWSLLNPSNKIKHVARVDYGSMTIYSEFE